jgi:serine/threonine protein kinase
MDPLAKALLGKALKRDDLVAGANLLGRYELLEPLGRGASSDVFRARDTSLDREVAVKVLRGMHDDPQRFAQEMKILAALDHPGIVRIYDGGSLDGRPYYVMELVEGEPLDPRGLPLRDAVTALRQVALACHAAHEQGVVHRDLKPANILVGEERAVVADFGVAKMLGAASATQTGTILGTPRYMAPEQWQGDPVDARTDVYALGVILYQVLTGEPPFPGEAMHEVAAQVTTSRPRAPRAIDPGVPRRLEATALRAMRKEIADRLPSARVFADELDTWLREGDSPEPKLTAPIVAGIGVIAAFGMLVVGVSLLRSGDPAPPTSALLVPSSSASPSASPGASPKTSPPSRPKPTPRAYLRAERQELERWCQASGLARAEERSALEALVGRLEGSPARTPRERVERALLVAQAKRATGEFDAACEVLGVALGEAESEEAARLHLMRAHVRWDQLLPFSLSEWGEGERWSRALDDVSTALKLGLTKSADRRLAALLLDLLRWKEDGVLDDLRAVEADGVLSSGQLELLRGQALVGGERSEDERGVPHLRAALGERLTRRPAQRALVFSLLELERPAQALRVLFADPGPGELDLELCQIVSLACGGERIAELAPHVPAESPLGERLGRGLSDEAPVERLVAYGTVEVLRALRRSAEDPARTDEVAFRRGLSTLRQAALRAPSDVTLLVTLAHASALAAEYIARDEAEREALIHAARTALRRLLRDEGNREREAVQELSEHLEQTFPR